MFTEKINPQIFSFSEIHKVLLYITQVNPIICSFKFFLPEAKHIFFKENQLSCIS